MQERAVERAKLVLSTLKHLTQALPGLVPREDLQRVEKASQTNRANPAVEALLPTQLTRMCAALVGVDVLEQQLDRVMEAVRKEFYDQVRSC